MAREDGSIIVKADVDDRNAEKKLSQLNKTIENTEKKISDLQAKRLPLVGQAEELKTALNEANDTLAYMQSNKGLFQDADVKEQVALVNRLQSEWNGVQKKISGVDLDLEKNNISLRKAKTEAGLLSAEMAGIGYQAKAALKDAEKQVNRFKMRLREVIRSALVFTLITQSLARLREWMGKVVKTNGEATAAMGRLKGALLTLAQPLVNVVIPAFAFFLNVLTDIVSTIASLVSFIFGTTVEESAKAAEEFDREAAAIDGVGSAAKKAGKNLASFDEINKLSGSSGAGSSGSEKGILANFSDLKEGIMSSLTISLKDVLFDWENLTGESILSKLVVALSAIAGGIIGFHLGGVGAVLGVSLGLSISNAVFNGDGKLDREEILNSIVLALGAITGGVLGFYVGGPFGAAVGVALGAGVSLGIKGLLFDGDGKLSGDEILGAIAVVLGAITGGVLGFMVGGPGGAAIGVIIGAGITAKIADVMFEQGDGAGVKNIIGGLVEFLVAIAGGLIGFAVGGPAGAAIGAVVGVGLSLLIDKLFFKDGTSGKNKAYEEGEKIGEDVIKGTNDALGINSPSTEYEESGGYMMQGLANGISNRKQIVLDAFKSVLSDLESWFLNWNDKFMLAVDAFGDGFSEKWNNIWRIAYIRFIFDWNNILSAFQDGVNNAISALNELVAEANALSKLTGTRYSFAPAITVGKLPIPQLAMGAVIPPNREFMAVLGDQKSGTNIETPLSTMIEAFRTAMRDMNMSGGQNEAYLVIDDEVMGKVVYNLYNKENRRVGVKMSGA